MPKTALAVAVADPRGHLVGKLDSLLPGMRERFDPLAVHTTTSTHPGILDLLEPVGARLASAAADPDAIGRHRREAVALALESGAVDHVLYMDLDHALRWLENDAHELEAAVRLMRHSDCVVIGRGPRSMAALPRRLVTTEGIVNEIFRLVSGRAWDVMMAARGLSRRAAEAIVNGCDVDTIGNDCAWPLFCQSRGFVLDYLEADGLTYQTNADYAAGAEDRRDMDPMAWALRVGLAAQHVEAMRPYMETP
ncbi:MAG: hypothetical protein AVDCRST_MAG22-3851 [uncultured Rubrobacteraceae bacterium]|uniref:Uncharacterized protein n=1 Tax=uncultured Rubrobacteraceae bacterium TaxID=349277 RepID=A0A6J4QAE2_9ACTN|nr:MAG: hypothetical protein AVDCRST_MAG22-3851 [uncultured Rubrobacteraceae bacterium]